MPSARSCTPLSACNRDRTRPSSCEPASEPGGHSPVWDMKPKCIYPLATYVNMVQSNPCLRKALALWATLPEREEKGFSISRMTNDTTPYHTTDVRGHLMPQLTTSTTKSRSGSTDQRYGVVAKGVRGRRIKQTSSIESSARDTVLQWYLCTRYNA